MNIAKRLLIMAGRDGTRPRKGGHMNIAGSIVIVTGASSGIGAATARELAQRGATVVLAARRAEELNRMASDLTQAGHKALGGSHRCGKPPEHQSPRGPNRRSLRSG